VSRIRKTEKEAKAPPSKKKGGAVEPNKEERIFFKFV
jgi:hypothetical protein